jgi:hypothetical protein
MIATTGVNNMKIALNIFTIIFFINNNKTYSQEKIIFDTYCYKYENPLAAPLADICFEFRKDKTFVYYFNGCMEQTKDVGTYFITSDTLTLNSPNQPSDFYNVTEQKLKSDLLTIELKDTSNQPFLSSGAYIITKDSTYWYSFDSMGIIKIPFLQFNTMIFYGLGLVSQYEYKPMDKTSNNFIVRAKYSNNNVFFKNQKFIVNNNILFPIEGAIVIRNKYLKRIKDKDKESYIR